MDELARKRKKAAVITGGVAAGLYVLMSVVVLASGYDNLGYGSVNNEVVTWSIFASLVLVMVALVSWCRQWTPKNGLTPWKRVGVFALVIWGVAVAFFFMAYLGTLVPPLGLVVALLSPASLVLFAPMLWFPIWTLIAAVRGSNSPERVVRKPPPQPAAAPLADPMAPPLAAAVLPAGMPEAVAQGYANAAQATAKKRTGRRLLIGGIAGATVLLLIVAGVGLYVGDQYMRAAQYESVIELVEESEGAMLAYFPKEDAAIKTRDAAGGTEAAQKTMEDTLRAESRAVAVRLGVIRSDLEDLSISGWHPEVEKFRDDYMDHLDAWLIRFEGLSTAADGAGMARVAEQQSVPIETTWEIVGETALEGMPKMYAGDLPDRVNEIFFSDAA